MCLQILYILEQLSPVGRWLYRCDQGLTRPAPETTPFIERHTHIDATTTDAVVADAAAACRCCRLLLLAPAAAAAPTAAYYCIFRTGVVELLLLFLLWLLWFAQLMSQTRSCCSPTIGIKWDRPTLSSIRLLSSGGISKLLIPFV